MPRPRLLENATVGSGLPPRLSIDMNRFTLIDSTGNKKPVNSLGLNIVIIDLNPVKSKLYWGKPYEQAAAADIPKCFSDNGVGPSSEASEPQHQTCMMCPHNERGSAISTFSGAKIKLCVDMKKIAFIIPGDTDRLIYLLTIKPGSFKAWDTYMNWLKSTKLERTLSEDGRAEPFDLVTTVTFTAQGRLKFEPCPAQNGGPALVADYATLVDQIKEAWERNISGSIVGQDDVPFHGALAAPAPVQQIAAPTPFMQPAPAVVAPQAPSAMPSTPAMAFPSEPAKPRRGRKTGATAATDFQTPNPQPAPTMAAPSSPAPIPAHAAAGQAADPLAIPAFLQRTTSQPVAPQSAPGFGMTVPATPDADLQSKIDAAFALPT